MTAHFQHAGAQLWYDDRGTGEPVVLLHGNLSDTRDFDGNLDRLADHHRLLLPERRGHGHTADTPGPLSTEVMTTDLIAFVEDRAGGPATLVGYSGGAAIALHTAVRRPDLVSRLVLLSGAFDQHTLLLRPRADTPAPPAILEAYAEVSPDGADHLPVVVRKLAESFDQDPPLTTDDLGKVSCPTLLIAADDDLVPLDHTLDLYRALPDSRLAVLPQASHLLLLEHPDLCTRLVRDFLTDHWTPRLMPITHH